jgi:hypothetical protein
MLFIKLKDDEGVLKDKFASLPLLLDRTSSNPVNYVLL